jgi:hypothetical protein
MYEPYNSDSTGRTMLILFGLILLSLVLYKLYDKETGSFRFSSANNIFDPHQKDKEEIKATIENAYIELMNGSLAYKSLGTSQDGGRFYNDNFTLTLASSFLPLMAMGNKIEVLNIKVIEFSDENSANVSYNLILSENEKSDSASVEMVVKKVGGNWKLDAEKFLDFKTKETKEKNSNKVKKMKS